MGYSLSFKATRKNIWANSLYWCRDLWSAKWYVGTLGPISAIMTTHGFTWSSSWWLNQPFWKIWSSNWIISSRFGMKIPKNMCVATTQSLEDLPLGILHFPHKTPSHHPWIYKQLQPAAANGRSGITCMAPKECDCGAFPENPWSLTASLPLEKWRLEGRRPSCPVEVWSLFGDELLNFRGGNEWNSWLCPLLVGWKYSTQYSLPTDLF